MVKRLGLKVINPETGELFEGLIIPLRPRIGGKWVRIFQDGKAELLRHSPQLRGQSFKVLYYLDAVVKWGNIIPPPRGVADALSLNEKAVYRAYAELIAASIVIKKGSIYSLSPRYCWKGNESQLEEAYRELTTTPVKQLVEVT